MRIPVRDIPQADDLATVTKVVGAVESGKTTYQGIADAIGLTGRQGRYYRLAAEILGFIKKSVRNTSHLTSSGREILSATGTKQRKLLASAVLGCTVVQRVIPFLESKSPQGCTRDELETLIGAVTHKTTKKMIHRRAATITSWLKFIDMVEVKNNRYVAKHLPYGLKVVDYLSDSEPLLPTTFELEEYEEVAERCSSSSGVSTYMVDESKRDRANAAHRMLTNLVAEKIRAAGAIPRRNALIDLAARIGNGLFIFEMKSSTSRNAHAQVRRGVSQLYEYRYLQAVPQARLVLVVQNPLPSALSWVGDYLTKDRDIMLAWDGDRRTIQCPDRLRKDLSFLL